MKTSIRVVMKYVLTLLLAAWLSPGLGRAAQKSSARDILVDTLPVPGLPINISNTSLTSTRQGPCLKFSASNGSNEELLGVRYLMLIVDSAGAVRSVVDQSESLRLEAYSAKEIRFGTPFKLKVNSEDRVFLVLAQIIGKESIWETIKAKDALQHYAKGDSYALPDVLRFPNQVDSPPRLSVIY